MKDSSICIHWSNLGIRITGPGAQDEELPLGGGGGGVQLIVPMSLK